MPSPPRRKSSASREQTELLRGIWNEMKGLKASFDYQHEATRRELGARIDQSNARLDQTNARLDQTNARLAGVEQRLDTTIVRLEGIEHRIDKVEGVLLELATQQRFVVRQLGTVLERDRHYQHDIDDLRTRVTTLEARVFPREG